MSMQHESLKQLEEQLGYSFKDKSLLVQALTHPSYTHTRGLSNTVNNQRLEFLGDSVISLILAEAVYRQFPNEREGKLTQIKGALEQGSCLAQLAEKIKIPDHILLSPGEKLQGTAKNESILEDSFEALIGAIFLDSDYITAKNIVLGFYQDLHTHLDKMLVGHNPKGQLQEYFQAKPEKNVITYQLLSSTGPDHLKRFVSQVIVDGKVLGTGEGSSKKEAEENAAREALQTLDKSDNL